MSSANYSRLLQNRGSRIDLYPILSKKKVCLEIGHNGCKKIESLHRLWKCNFSSDKISPHKILFSFVHNLCRLNFLQCEIYILIIYNIKTFDTHQWPDKSSVCVYVLYILGSEHCWDSGETAENTLTGTVSRNNSDSDSVTTIIFIA